MITTSVRRRTPRPLRPAVKKLIWWAAHPPSRFRRIAQPAKRLIPDVAKRWARAIAESPEALPVYYVNRYMIPGYGTRAQLAHGVQDHRPPDPVPDQLLERLLRAWHTMKEAQATGIPPAYIISGEWRAIVDQFFRPLTRALDEGDRAVLSDQLKNFFRLYGTFFGEPVNFMDESVARERCELFRVHISRWTDLYGEEALPEAQNPRIGNPMGFVIDGAFYTSDGLTHDFYARRMVDLVGHVDAPRVCEVGGGFGGFAYHLLNNRGISFKYIDYDIPVMAIVTAYYLSTALPDKRIALFGELSPSDPLADCDAAILPNFTLPHLQNLSVEICFNSSSFAEMDEPTVTEYLLQFGRVSRMFIMYRDHVWGWNSRNAYYQTASGFKHWNISHVQPPIQAFRRLHKIPSPFISDIYGEFFEWLYMRRPDPME